MQSDCIMKVTIISGFLGSGKTTLLRRLLREQKARSLGVIVNDMADLEVDGDLLRAGERVSEEHGNFISLYAGSISGDRRTAFAQALEQWRDRCDLEHVLVETSGSTHPWPLIEELVKRPAYEIDTFVTLLDVKAFIEDYGAGKLLFEELIRNEAQQKRSTANLLAEQIQFADLILLTKTDRIRAGPDGRLAGSTFDPCGLYRFNAVQAMLKREGLTTAAVNAHVDPLLMSLAAELDETGLGSARLLNPAIMQPRARFLALESPRARAWQDAFAPAGVVTDLRGDVLRIGVGLYHDEDDITHFCDIAASF
jgi:hypothetical protein